MRVHSNSYRWLDSLLILTVAIVSLYGIVRLGSAPRNPASGIGVVFAPWVSQAAAATRATEPGARLVRFGGLPFIVVVMPDTPDYAARMAADGALLLVDPQILAACMRLVGGEAQS